MLTEKHSGTRAALLGWGTDKTEGEWMNFESCKEKYFILVEGDERAVIRDTAEAAERKRKKLAKHSKGKKIFVFKSKERNRG